MGNKLGEFIKQRRSEQGLSLRGFAKLCGVSHTHLSSIEKGIDTCTGKDLNITSETLHKLSGALGVSEADLVNMDRGEELSLNLREEKEIINILEETKQLLEQKKGLLFDGKPVTREQLQSIVDAMQVGVELAKKRKMQGEK